jgi:hypothetical protein
VALGQALSSVQMRTAIPCCENEQDGKSIQL